MLREDTPLVLLQSVRERFGNCFATMDQLRQEKLPLSDRCYLPTDLAIRVLGENTRMELSAAASAGTLLAACYGWENTGRHLYCYDPDFARLMASQADGMEDGASLPVGILENLGSDCIYVKAPDVVANHFDGFFAWVDVDMQAKEHSLQFLFCYEDIQDTFAIRLYLDRGELVSSCLPAPEELVQRAVSAWEWEKPCAAALLVHGSLAPASLLRQMLLRALQLVLYLVSAEPEIRQDDAAQELGDAVILTVGTATGTQLRHHPGNGKNRRAHFRQGHWHRYWTGPKKDPSKRQMVLKWVAPVLVGAADQESVVIVTVGESKR